MWTNQSRRRIAATVGAALLTAPVFPAHASSVPTATVDWADAAVLDLFQVSCAWKNAQSEIDCFANNFGITITGEDIGNVGDPPEFLEVINLPTAPVDLTGGDIFAVLIPQEKVGGYWAIKTGATESEKAAGKEAAKEQRIFIFQNLANMLYATLDLSDFKLEGYDFEDIEKISHMTSAGSIPQVPLPGAAFLFGSALLGGGLMRRRRKTAR